LGSGRTELKAAFGQLVIPFKSDSLGWVDRRTLRLFRFDDLEKRLEMLADAVPHRDLPVFYTAIDRPGRYGLIGE
jgi:hypothetical protein